MTRIGPNERCPCGSGKKYKKCCDGPQVVTSTQQDRAAALAALHAYVCDDLADEDELAWDEFNPEIDPLELGATYKQMSEDCFDAWFRFDRPLPDGRLVVDAFLAKDRSLSPGARHFLQGMRTTTMRLYEVVDVRPGAALTLQDALDGSRTTVAERTASRTLPLHSWIALRINPRGPSNGPEIEFGALAIGGLTERMMRDGIRAQRQEFEGTDAAFFKEMAPWFHEGWAQSIVDPPVPALANTDGEPLTQTHVRFEGVGPEALTAALTGRAGFDYDDETGWIWTGDNQRGELVTLGVLRFSGPAELVLEVNSTGRGERGRAALEAALGGALRHVGTSHEDMRRRVKDALRARLQDGTDEQEKPAGLPADLNESLVLEHLSRHYRAWVDGGVPALDGRTPRAAAQDPAYHDRLVSLLGGLDTHYQQALRSRQPAWDPSWIWEELGVTGRFLDDGPPSLAHERIAERAPSSVTVCREVAARLRALPTFDGMGTPDPETVDGDLGVLRLVREEPWLAPHLRYLVGFEMHSRKTFRVDPGLAWMFGNTEIDLPGQNLRLPFPSFALVFNDRHTLSLAERLLAARGSSSLAGHLLRVVTVYVSEPVSSPRLIHVNIAMDALAADPPELVTFTLALADQTPVQHAIRAVLPNAEERAEVSASTPLKGLAQIIVNAVLYATSAGAPQKVRGPNRAAQASSGAGPAAPLRSDEVFFLPGTIDITQVRRLQELERTQEGRALLHRFMVRGHWRRPAASYADQRLKWIEPYWKGPDIAATIERVYRLKG